MLAQIIGPDGILVAIVVVAVLFLGGRKIPALARSLGGAHHDFKRGLAEGDERPALAVGTAPTTARDAALGVAPVMTHVDVFHHVD
jgi:TatA/E family protein of Tat protein translocase